MIAIVGTGRKGTSTLPTTAISSTDSSNIYWDEHYYIITNIDDIPEVHELEIPKENKVIPKFKVVKNLRNSMKIKTFVENRQLNFHIRNAL